MRGDFKLMFFGFFSGLAIGAFALTSVSASIEGKTPRADRANRAPLVDRTLSYDDAPAQLAPRPAAKTLAAGETPTVIEYFDARGRLVYRSDPATATTSVAKGTIIPTPTTLERDNAAQRMVRAEDEPAVSVPAAN